MIRFRTPAAVALALLLAAAVPAQDEGGVAASLELNQNFFYENDAFPIRVSVRNDGDSTVDNPVPGALLDGFRVKNAAGETLAPAAGETKPTEPQRPAKLAAGAFYGWVLDLAEVYPQLATVGTYTIEWNRNGLEAPSLTVRVLPEFDPSKLYEATLVTPEGEIVLRLHGDRAPIAVKAFVDMANADFYDGLLVHEVRPDRFFTFGDPSTGTSPRIPFLYPLERTSVPLVAGSVVMKPARPAPPANGSEVIILLQPEPAWDGQVTAFGQVVRGMDLVRKISNLASSGRNSRPFFRPIEDFRLTDVRIEAKAPDSDPS